MSQISAVIVEGEWDPADNSVVKLKLQVYFGNAKRSSGGDCLVQMADAAPRASLYFSEAAGECAMTRVSQSDRPVPSWEPAQTHFESPKSFLRDVEMSQLFLSCSLGFSGGELPPVSWIEVKQRVWILVRCVFRGAELWNVYEKEKSTGKETLQHVCHMRPVRKTTLGGGPQMKPRKADSSEDIRSDYHANLISRS